MEHIKTKRLSEKPDDITLFTAQFWNDWVMIGETKLPLGQVSVDILNLDLEELQALRFKNADMFYAFAELIKPNKKLSRTDLDKVQKLLNSSLDELKKLPIYKNLKMDWDSIYSCFSFDTEYLEAVFKTDFDTDLRNDTIEFIKSVYKIPDEMSTFHIYTRFMMDGYFERLGRRSSEYYAVGVYDFLMNEEFQKKIADSVVGVSGEPYKQAHYAKFEFVTMPNPFQ